jgi:hypothetical protein
MARRKHCASLVVGGLLALAGAAWAAEASLIGLAAGTFPVVEPASYGGGWGVLSMLDETSDSGWASPQGSLGPHAVVLELPAPATFTAFEFDTRAVDGPGRAANGIEVAVSDTGKDAGFRQVLRAGLEEGRDAQRFAVSAQVQGRWVRLTIAGNHGDAEYTELMGWRGFGSAASAPPLADVSGTYTTDYNDFHIRQQGSALVGCYEHDEGLLEGSVEGRVMRLTWREGGGPGDDGPAVMLFAPDGRSFRGVWWGHDGGSGAPSGEWNGTKKSAVVGSCPHWSGSVAGELRRELGKSGRARLHGILFDIDSATIRGESQAVLDEVAKLMAAEPEWRLLVEGHTDAEAGTEHNQKLSEARAAAVRAALVERGVDPARLRAAGFGESRPVGDNATAVGRAQNRRVELVRE